ncbi:MAG: hypothetical protein JSV44_09550 [Candidatus Zixiibacteriota bacterium]|nr:MAG: hypothetical protein JSV44_09550 [candidate division Zixibacteria bacterium]
MKSLFKKIWTGWKKFARTLVRIQLEIILFLFYFGIFMPFGLMLKLFRHDPLNLRHKGNSSWREVDIGHFDPDRATHQS